MKKSVLDLRVEAEIKAHIETFGIDPLDAVKHYTTLVRRHWFKRLAAHIELFKLALPVPGDIAELGVFRGAGLFTWANLLETYAIGDRSKTVYGFDNWAGFKTLAPEDGSHVPEVGKMVGGFDPSAFRKELDSAIRIFDGDRFIPQKPRIKLIDGDIETSLPAFVSANPGIRFSLVHFDCDLYAPTMRGLEAIWPAVPRGGVIVFDEYAIPEWTGETKAVDDFLSDKQEQRLTTFPWTNVPGAYLVKA